MSIIIRMEMYSMVAGRMISEKEMDEYSSEIRVFTQASSSMTQHRGRESIVIKMGTYSSQ